jgi:hypothetical protein
VKWRKIKYIRKDYTKTLDFVSEICYNRDNNVMDIEILDKLDVRTMQKECARALLTMDGTSHGIARFNKQARHNSQNWYKAVLREYIEEHGGLPKDVGPAKDILLFSEKLGC